MSMFQDASHMVFTDSQFTIYNISHGEESLTEKQTQTLRRIGAPNYESDFRSADRRRHEGTCEWLWRRPEFASWMVFRWTSLLVIFGIAGAGKTILASWLIKQSRLSPPPHMCIYHFFKDTDDNKNTPLAATRSLLDQVYKHIRQTDHASTLESQLKAQTENTHWPVEFEPLWETLHDILLSFARSSQLPSPTPSVTIILDALDECKHSKQLVRSLRRLVHEAADMIRVVVTSRRSGDHVDDLTQPYPDQCSLTFFDISQNDVQHDIASFVGYKISRIPRLRPTEHEPLRRKVIAVFSNIQHHQGMFLWAHLMCKELKQLQTIGEMWDLLKNIPPGLEAMYERICVRLLKNSLRYREFGHVVLQWVFASNRPITLIELKEALRAMRVYATGGQSMRWDDELIWSREDIVKSCGDLVRYSDEGDTIAPLHLSAQQFFCTPITELPQKYPNITISTIRPFLVDIPHTEFTIAMTCLKYMLSTSPLSNQYLFLDASGRTPKQNEFRERYPLLGYSVMYWPEYALRRLQDVNQDNNHLKLLMTTLAEFTHSPTSTIWLEELIRLTYLELLQNIVRRFIALNHPNMPVHLSKWFDRVTRVLHNFSITLSSSPHMVKLGLMQDEQTGPPDSTFYDERLPPLNVMRERWIHYDPSSDHLLSLETWSQIPKLRCQVMKTGLRLQPLSARREGNNFLLTSAAFRLSDRCNFLSAMYEGDSQSTLGRVRYITCWRINYTDAVSRTSDWADIILHQRFDIPGQSYLRRTGVLNLAFSGDNALLTPHGVFNIETQEWLVQPTTMYNTLPGKVVLNDSGSHFVRFYDSKLEVADINSTYVVKHEVHDEIKVAYLGTTGNKLIVWTTHRQFCFLPNEDEEIDMPGAVSWWPPAKKMQFTKDEGKFIAFIPKRNQVAVGVWTFVEDGDVHVALIHTALQGFAFCLVSETPDHSDPDILIASDSGTIVRRPIGVHSPPPTQHADDTTKHKKSASVIVDDGSALKLFVWSQMESDDAYKNTMRIQTWNLETQKLLSQFERLVPPYINLDYDFFLSPQGNRLVAGSHILEFRIDDTVFGICVMPVEAIDVEIINSQNLRPEVAISKDGTRLALAVMYSLQGVAVERLYLYEIAEGPEIVGDVSITFGHKITNMPVFSYHDSNLLATGPYVLNFEEDDLVINRAFHTDDKIRGLSTCGSSCLVHSKTQYPFPESAAQFIPPRSLIYLEDTYAYYICLPYVVEIQREGLVIYLKITGNNNANLERPIYIFPDRACDNSNVYSVCDEPDSDVHMHVPSSDRNVNIFGPIEDGGNLKLVVLLEGVPEFIDTGVTWDELLEACQCDFGTATDRHVSLTKILRSDVNTRRESIAEGLVDLTLDDL